MNWNFKQPLRRQERNQSLHRIPNPATSSPAPGVNPAFAAIFPGKRPLLPSRSNVLHQRRNLHELDLGTYAVEIRYPLKERLTEKVLGRVL